MRGSAHNDLFVTAASAAEEGGVGGGTLRVASNYAGGTLGGISSGAPLYFRVAVKVSLSLFYLPLLLHFMRILLTFFCC